MQSGGVLDRPRTGSVTLGRDHVLPGLVVVAAIVAAALAALAGIGAGTVGWLMLPIIAGVLVAVCVLYRPFFGVILLAATIPVETILTFGGLGLGRVIGLAVFAAWFVQKLVLRQSWRRVVFGAYFKVSVTFLVLVLASMLWAQHPQPVMSGFNRIAQMFALTLIIIDLGFTKKRLDLIAKVLVLSALVAASITLYQALILGVRRAGGDISGDVNGTAMLLVTLLPLGFYLLRTAFGTPWKLLATIFIGISVVSVVTTYSRMNLLLLPPLLVTLSVLAARDRRSRRWLVAVTVTGTAGAIFLVPWDKLAERTETIGAYVDETTRFSQESTTTSPRGYHMRIGLAIARDHPIVGAGYGNYGYLFRDEYQFQVSGRDNLYGSVRDPHSSYVGIAADLGVLGLALWLVILLSCAARGVRAWWRSRSAGDRGLMALTESLLVMLGLHIFAYGFYAQHQYDKLLWIVLAMNVAVAYVAAKERTGEMRSGAFLASAPATRVTDAPVGPTTYAGV